MKYIKKFENLQTEPQIGDYVICKEIFFSEKKEELNNFLKNNIGKYINYETSKPDFPYEVEYENIPEIIKKNNFGDDNCRYFTRDEILYFSSNEDDFESYIISNKYNL